MINGVHFGDLHAGLGAPPLPAVVVHQGARFSAHRVARVDTGHTRDNEPSDDGSVIDSAIRSTGQRDRSAPGLWTVDVASLAGGDRRAAGRAAARRTRAPRRRLAGARPAGRATRPPPERPHRVTTLDAAAAPGQHSR